MKIAKKNINDSLRSIEEYWSPVVLSDLNDQQVKLAKVKGDFVMHNHEYEDEFFYVVKGRLNIELEEGTIALDAGECVTIPRGINHRPFAETETWIMMFEPKSTINTGQIENELTKTELKRI